MVEEPAGKTYLFIEVGHVLTHAAYVASVEDTARLVALGQASTTSTAASAALLDGVRRATANLELLIGRQLLDSTGELRRPTDSDGHGVDAAVLTTSLAPPLRVALVGLTRDFSLASAIRAVTVPYITLTRTVCLETSSRRWETDDLQALVEDPPDVLILVGGIDGGPVAPIRDMGETLSAAYSVLPEKSRPAVIFAGNERAHRPLMAALAGVADLRLVGNVRPSTRTENLGDLRSELARLFYSREISQPAGLRALAQWGGTNVMYDLDALARTLRFAARRFAIERGVLGVDVGGSGTRLLHVQAQGAALTWAAPYGTGTGLGALRGLGDPLAVIRWLHHPLSWAEVWDRLSNAEVRPAGVPQSEEDWDLQQASAREAVCRSWAGARTAWAAYSGHGREPGVDMVVGRGTVLTHARTPGQAALILIDALEPWGLLRLSLDWANLLPGLTGLAQLHAMAAVQAFDHDGLLELGTLVAPRGPARAGSPALKARLVVRDETRSELTVPSGSIRRLPLGTNERGRLELELLGKMDLRLKPDARRGAVEVRGGALGVIIDARGRPLVLPTAEADRRQLLETWQQEIDQA